MVAKGIVERTDPSGVRGWAYIPDLADAHLNIKVLLNGSVIGQGNADDVREDLIKARIGKGDHAFDVRFAANLAPQDLERIEVVAVTPMGHEFSLNPSKFELVHTEIPATASERPVAPSRLAVFPMPATDTTQFPVFILGAARSGTSAVTHALLQCGHYQGFEEGHCIWLLRRFLETINEFYAFNGEDGLPDRFTMLSHVPYTYLTQSARATFISAAAEMFPTGRWIDKTPRPEMIEAAPLMQELWPNARFIFMKRRGIENVRSRLVKFPQIAFADHCTDWARSMTQWLSVRDLLSPRAIEIEQRAVALEPDRVAREIGRFLEMSNDVVEQLAYSLRHEFPQRTSDIRAGTLNITEVGWSVARMTEFRRTCGPMMAAFGYGYDTNYFSAPMASIGI